jgi:hypothetical protein
MAERFAASLRVVPDEDFDDIQVGGPELTLAEVGVLYPEQRHKSLVLIRKGDLQGVSKLTGIPVATLECYEDGRLFPTRTDLSLLATAYEIRSETLLQLFGYE